MPQNTKLSDRLLTPDEVADVLSLSRELVLKQARAGKIPAIKLGKAWRFRLPAIERWVAEAERQEQEAR